MATVTLTAAANAAAQFLGVLDSGESLSTQQVTDALAVANNLLESWWQEQTLALQVLITEQAKAGVVFVDTLTKAAAPLITAFTLAGAIYTPAQFIAPVLGTGTMPQFADATTPLTLPAAWVRALKLGLAVELAPQYAVEPAAALVQDYAAARAAATKAPAPEAPAE